MAKNKSNFTWIIIPVLFLAGLFAIVYWLPSIVDDDGSEIIVPTRYNFIVLLDLSDRIDPNLNPHQYTRDSAVIHRIFDVYRNLVSDKMFVKSKDRFQVLIAPQESDNSNELTVISDGLYLDMSSSVISEKKKQIDEFEDELPDKLSSLYRLATVQNEHQGADIWSFFNDKLNHFLLFSNSNGYPVKNMIFILTDGYLLFERSVYSERHKVENRTTYMQVNGLLELADWETEFENNDYGLVSIDKEFDELVVFMLELHYRQRLNTSESKIIQKYWTKWFDEMSITDAFFADNEYTLNQIEDMINFVVQDTMAN